VRFCVFQMYYEFVCRLVGGQFKASGLLYYFGSRCCLAVRTSERCPFLRERGCDGVMCGDKGKGGITAPADVGASLLD